MTCTDGLTIAPGGDWTQTVALTDANGAAIDGLGLAASIVDVTGVLGSAVGVAIVTVNPLTVRLDVTWQAAWPTTAARLGTARLALNSNVDENASLPFTVDVSGFAARIIHPRGADGVWPFTWPDDRAGASLTSETVEIINASATLAPLASVVVTNAATRACELRIDGDLAAALGYAGTLQLRRQIAGAQPRALPPLAVSFL
jgi:hypothetical protein